MKKQLEFIRHVANNIVKEFPGFSEGLFKCASQLEQYPTDQKDKLEFMVEMIRIGHNIEMDDNGDFKSELINAMFVGWMAKTNKGVK